LGTETRSVCIANRDCRGTGGVGGAASVIIITIIETRLNELVLFKKKVTILLTVHAMAGYRLVVLITQ